MIFAGYPKKMKEFLARNEGLRSRIIFHVDFPDYTPEELDRETLFELRAADADTDIAARYEKKNRQIAFAG